MQVSSPGRKSPEMPLRISFRPFCACTMNPRPSHSNVAEGFERSMKVKMRASDLLVRSVAGETGDASPLSNAPSPWPSVGIASVAMLPQGTTEWCRHKRAKHRARQARWLQPYEKRSTPTTAQPLRPCLRRPALRIHTHMCVCVCRSSCSDERVARPDVSLPRDHAAQH